MVTLETPKTAPGQAKPLPTATQDDSSVRQRAMMDTMNPSTLVKLEWWANRSTCLGSFAAHIEIHERVSDLSATGRLAVEALNDPNTLKGWCLLCSIDPVFRLVFEDGSDFEVQVDPGAETGAFELTEYTAGPTRKVTLDLSLLA